MPLRYEIGCPFVTKKNFFLEAKKGFLIRMLHNVTTYLCKKVQKSELNRSSLSETNSWDNSWPPEHKVLKK